MENPTLQCLQSKVMEDGCLKCENQSQSII